MSIVHKETKMVDDVILLMRKFNMKKIQTKVIIFKSEDRSNHQGALRRE